MNNKHQSLKVFSVVNKMIKKILTSRNTYELVDNRAMQVILKKKKTIIGQWGYKPLVENPHMGSYHVLSFLPSIIKQDLRIYFYRQFLKKKTILYSSLISFCSYKKSKVES